MTKQELIDRIHKKKGMKQGITKRAVAEVIDGVFAELGDYFIKARTKGGVAPRFTYPGFGTFSKRTRPKREGRHPKTGAVITIPSNETLAFTVGSDLKTLLNRLPKT